MNYWVTYPLTQRNRQSRIHDQGRADPASAKLPKQLDSQGSASPTTPPPTHKWLHACGHDALDPFTVLSFCAAVTDRLRLIPNILGLPYLNSFLVAKAAATLDVLSDGRFTLAVASGLHARRQNKALGVDFEQRNALFYEAIEVIRGVWSEDESPTRARPSAPRDRRPTRSPRPHPPIWIGGNSRLSRQARGPLRRRLEPRFPPPEPWPAPPRRGPSRPSTTSARCSMSSGSSWEEARPRPRQHRRGVRHRRRRQPGRRLLQSRGAPGCRRRTDGARRHLVGRRRARRLAGPRPRGPRCSPALPSSADAPPHPPRPAPAALDCRHLVRRDEGRKGGPNEEPHVRAHRGFERPRLCCAGRPLRFHLPPTAEVDSTPATTPARVHDHHTALQAGMIFDFFAAG